MTEIYIGVSYSHHLQKNCDFLITWRGEKKKRFFKVSVCVSSTHFCLCYYSYKFPLMLFFFLSFCWCKLSAHSSVKQSSAGRGTFFPSSLLLLSYVAAEVLARQQITYCTRSRRGETSEKSQSPCATVTVSKRIIKVNESQLWHQNPLTIVC